MPDSQFVDRPVQAIEPAVLNPAVDRAQLDAFLDAAQIVDNLLPQLPVSVASEVAHIS
jgi:hypothetical protein